MAKKDTIIYLNKLKRDKKSSIFDLIIISVLSIGIIYSFLPCISSDNFLNILPFRFSYTLPFIAVIISIIITLFQKIKQKSLKKFIITLIITITIFIILFNPNSIYRGFLGTVSRVIELWNIKFQDSIPFSNIGFNSFDLQAFTIFLNIIVCLLLHKAIKNNKVTLLGITLLAIQCFALILGCNFVICGCVVFIAWISIWYRNIIGRLSNFALCWIICCGVMCCGFYIFVNNTNIKFIDNIRTTIKDNYYQVRYGNDTLPKGELAKAYLMHTNNEKRILINMSSAKTLYLKGFVGNIYKNGKWVDLPKSSFRGKYTGIFGWLERNNFNPDEQYKSYVELSVKPYNYYKLDVDIKNLGADRRYIYLPYSIKNFSEKNISYNNGNQITSKNFFGCKEYSFQEQSQDLPSELLEDEDWILFPKNKNQNQYLDTEQIYRTFVYDNYLAVPEEYQELINNLFWNETDTINDNEESKNLNIYQATEKIRKILAENIIYNDKPEKNPPDTEPLKWYLEKYKQANAPIYASLSVLAYRQKGIPARYVEGYFVNKTNEFVENWGTSLVLTSMDSHAWTEVYFDGIGWLPIDTTEGYYFNTYELKNILVQSENKNNNLDNENNIKIENFIDLNQKKLNSVKFNKNIKFTFLAFIGIITIIIFLLIITILLTELYRLILWLYNKNKYKNMSPNEKTLFLFREIKKVFKIIEIEIILGKNSNEADKLITEKLENINPNDYLRVYQLIEKVVFGGIELKQYEQRTIEIFLKNIVTSGYNLKKLKLIQKFKLRYIFTSF